MNFSKSWNGPKWQNLKLVYKVGHFLYLYSYVIISWWDCSLDALPSAGWSYILVSRFMGDPFWGKKKVWNGSKCEKKKKTTLPYKREPIWKISLQESYFI